MKNREWVREVESQFTGNYVKAPNLATGEDVMLFFGSRGLSGMKR